MTQDEKWQAQYDEMVAFINKNHRNPSKYVNEERGLVNWCKHQRKIINAGPQTTSASQASFLLH